MPVKILPEEIVSLIAAGEVIESPASVLKELIENSVDAGALNVDVELKKAGRELIRVKDDGCGMSREDLELSVYPHATSKIQSYEDLHSLSTYGFRGEALYSAFSVSRIKIQTFNGNGLSGFSLEGEGTDHSKTNIKPAPPVKGTIVEVRDLFYNTPARKKFLKSDNSLKAAAIRVVEEFILSRPEISFSLKIDSTPVFSVKSSADGAAGALKQVFMPKTAQKMIRLEGSSGSLKLYGWVLDPSALISSRSSQYYFVNSRAIESNIMRQAVYRAYEHVRNGKHPALALFIEGPGQDIDVNVHPQKKEVKFRDEKSVYELVYSLVSSAIMSKQTAPRFYTQDSAPMPEAVNESISKPADSTPARPPSLSQYAQQDFLEHIYSDQQNPNWYKPPINFVGQVFESLLIFQTSDSLLIMDQHAAVERILFERYLSDFEKNSIQVQDLLIPADIELPVSQAENLMRWKDWLSKAGFEINRSGPGMIKAYSSPAVFYFTPQALKDFFLYLSEVLGNPQKAPEDLKRNSIATLACKKSIKAREKVDSVSALKIVEELKSCKDSLHCPHGRPTIIELTLDDMVRKFGRSSI